MAGGGGDGIIPHLARKAAAMARNETAARAAAMRSVRRYRGVQERQNTNSISYYAVIWNRSADGRNLMWLGSYRTPEEAAYAYDAAARALRGHRARPNFPEPARAPEEVSTELVLALPTPVRAPVRRQPAAAAVLAAAAAAAAQASFDNWLSSGSSAVSQAGGVSGLAVVGDNFTGDGASSSSSAPPPVPRLTLDLVLGLPGHGGTGGAQ